ncbi:hypothetical protein V8C26DRAFT_310547 [Trichoderma gracile]
MPCPCHARPCPNDACAARSLHHLEPALLFLLFASCSHTSPSSFSSFPLQPFPFPFLHRIPNPPILDKPRRELVIVRRRLDSGSSREPIPFVCLQLAAVQVALLCSHGLSAVAACSSRHVYIRSTFTSLEGFEKLLSGPLYHIEVSSRSLSCITDSRRSDPVHRTYRVISPRRQLDGSLIFVLPSLLLPITMPNSIDRSLLGIASQRRVS